MLDLSATPISKLSGWGAIEDEGVVGRPATSKCENTAFGGSPSPSPPPTPSPTTKTTTTTTKDDDEGEDECSDKCSYQFVNRCMDFWMKRMRLSATDAYSKCRRDLDNGKGPISKKRFGCKRMCTDSKEMKAAKSR